MKSLVVLLLFCVMSHGGFAIKCWQTNELDLIPGEKPEEVKDCNTFGPDHDICVWDSSQLLDKPSEKPFVDKFCGKSTDFFGYTSKCQDYQTFTLTGTVCVCDSDECNKDKPSGLGLLGILGIGVGVVVAVAVVAGIVGFVVMKRRGNEGVGYAGGVANPNF